MSRRSHHGPRGVFRNPWPTATMQGLVSFLRWQLARLGSSAPPTPPAELLPRGRSEIVRPRAGAEALRATWVGHSTYLLQVGGVNVLTDPHWSERAFPVQWTGPRRLTAPGLSFGELPPIDVVLLSHDHYDHLDDRTVRRLHRRFGEGIRWFTPLGHRAWFEKRGIQVVELDWWEEACFLGPEGEVRIRCLPVQHWCSRTPWDNQRRLWSSWSVEAAGGRRIYFGGDSGWFPDYGEIGERAGPFDLLLMPIGAYEPRWFNRTVHMSPEDALRAYREMGEEGVFAAMHWGTFRLTAEDPLEPPARMRASWREAGLPHDRLWIPRHGETLDVAIHRA